MDGDTIQMLTKALLNHSSLERLFLKGKYKRNLMFNILNRK